MATHPSRVTSQSRSDFTSIVQRAYEKPDPSPSFTESGHSSLDPRSWRRRTWLIIALVTVVAVVIGIAIAVVIIRANRYPNYSSLNYHLTQVFHGEDFFSNFNYFSGYDPAQGFVQ